MQRNKVRIRLKPVPDRDDAFVVVARVRDSDQAVFPDAAGKLRRLLKKIVPARPSAAKNFEPDFHRYFNESMI